MDNNSENQQYYPIHNAFEDIPISGEMSVFDGTHTIRIDFKRPHKKRLHALYIPAKHKNRFIANLRTIADKMENGRNEIN